MKLIEAMKRFDEHVEKDPESGCWIWKGKIRGGQPDRIRINNVRRSPRRLAIELYTDSPLPPSKWWLRAKCGKCDCVNPKCLKAERPNKNLDDCERQQIVEAIKLMRCEASGRHFHSVHDLAQFFKRTLGVSVRTVYRLNEEVNQCPKI